MRWEWLIIAVLGILLVFSYNKDEEVVTMVDSVVVHDTITDTIYSSPDVVYEVLPEYVPIYPPDIQDSVNIDFNTLRVYVDSVKNDSNALIVIKDTIKYNKIQGRSALVDVYPKTKTITRETVVYERKNKLYYGIGLSPTSSPSFTPSVLYVTKQELGYQLGYDVLNSEIYLNFFFKF